MYKRNDDGNLIDPPVLKDYEQRLYAAQEAASPDDVEEIQEEYETARNEYADKMNAREQKRLDAQDEADITRRDEMRAAREPKSEPTPEKTRVII